MREIRESRENLLAGEVARPGRPVALLIDDGHDDWVLPDEPFTAAGCRPVRSAGLREARASCANATPDLVFIPLTLGGKQVNAQLAECLSLDPAPVIVVVATNDQINAAAEAMRLGAYDCLFKPFSPGRLTRTIEAAVKKIKHAPQPDKRTTRTSRPAGLVTRPARAEATAHPPQEPAPPLSPQTVDGLNLSRRGFVASAAATRKALDRAVSIAASDAAVLISGEIGTGKSTFAGIVHDASPRAGGPMVTVSCATLTVRDFDNQVFGPQGALARAAGGTLYLDEIADLSGAVQSRLARIIESTPPARDGPGPRFVGSTVHAPNAALQNGLIRPELFYRLHVAPLALPPLRDREGDAALIAQVRLAQFSEVEGRGFTGFSQTALARISDYAWPGNLRELINVIQTIVLMNQGPLVTAELLPPEVRAGSRFARTASAEPSTGSAASAGAAPGRPDEFVGKTLAEIERMVIEATILAEDGSVPRAAKVLDVSPSTLYRKRDAWAKTLRDKL
ncbi:MAG: sigma-54-dependent Fis family transcriptional regulator [Maritimibacter sp.]|nr:sigma-54-dependent Fis family transcriptional regulator [Maritimibacter sp.]